MAVTKAKKKVVKKYHMALHMLLRLITIHVLQSQTSLVLF